ncbi:hypothetical protein B1R32_103104 [Abditibacterium utsteinense]|uniref:Uncharacterized protein n=1 Tax=Abditibacterium utsteinense TaxID=1960156 RepID=A0A2S8SVL8_9BACT|nr:hypothetical protein [Abditibacterium utsteinense]PQV64837.1 hypothetical protein B1R32_103104 [Abditibacterium utsteinense]
MVPATNGAGLPTGSRLPDGQYEIYATGTDTLANYSSISILVTKKAGVSTRTSATITSAPPL